MKIYTVQATTFDPGNFATTVDKGDFKSYDEACEHIVTLSNAGCPAGYNIVVREVAEDAAADAESVEFSAGRSLAARMGWESAAEEVGKAKKLKKFRSEVAQRMGWEPAAEEVDDVLGIVKALHAQVRELRERVKELEEFQEDVTGLYRVTTGRSWRNHRDV